jgi:hypothetical protein
MKSKTLQIHAFLLAILGSMSLATAQNTIEVTNTDDSGPGSLRQAIADANSTAGADIINFTGATFTDFPPDEINIQSELPQFFGGETTINGPGANKLTIRRPGTATSNYGIMRIDSSANVTVRGVTITGGRDPSPSLGGGIRNDGTLTLIQVTVSGNTATFGGGIYNTGTLTLSQATVSSNTGGGIYNAGGTRLGSGNLKLTQATVSGNTATTRDGGGIVSYSGTLVISQTTISGNTARSGGGIARFDGGTLTMSNSLIVGNSATTNNEIRGAITTNQGGNLTAIPNGSTISNILAPLASNGGPTQTHELVVGSPAINRGVTANTPADALDLDGDLNITEPVPFDQRGVGFARQIDIVDMGAIEFGSTISLAATDEIAAEEASNTATFTFTRSNSIGALTVNYVTDDSSTASASDYTLSGTAGQVTFADGSSTATVTLTATVETLNSSEIAETLSLSIAPGSGYIIGTPDTVTATIAQNGFIVVNTNDAGEGSLRLAILNSNGIVGPETITFEGETFTNATAYVIDIQSQLPAFTGETTVMGPGADKLTIRRPSTATSEYRIMQVDTGANVTVSGVTITGGRDLSGGGILNRGTLTLIQAAVSGNAATSGPGGGINNSRTLTLIQTVVSGNGSTSGSGGGVYNVDTLLLIQTTISGNTAFSLGGGIQNLGFTLRLIQSTVSGNTAASGRGGGISSLTRPLTLSNTLIVGNTARITPEVESRFITDQGGNLTSIPSGSTISDILSPLANNGGPTQTHALVAGSPAINRGATDIIPIDTLDLDGDLNITEPVPFDQRGIGFVRQIDTVDIGAFEQTRFLNIAAVLPATVEGSGTGTRNAQFTVSRNGGTTSNSTVTYTVSGSGANPAAAADFLGGGFPTGVATIPTGQTSVTINIPIARDATLERTETYTVTLSNPSPNDAIATASANSSINDDDSLTALVSSINPSIFGQNITLTANVTQGTGTPTGTVTFRNGASDLGTGILNASGIATLNTTVLPASSNNLSAEYSGAGVIGMSTGTLTQNVNKSNTEITVRAAVNPTEPEQDATFGVAVTAVAPGAGVPNGTVTFFDGTVLLGRVTLFSSAVSLATASFTTNTLTNGNHTITARFDGDANFNVSTSSELSHTVGPKTITIIAGNNQNTTVNTAFGTPLQVEVRNALNQVLQDVPVSFTINGSGATGRFPGDATTQIVNTDSNGLSAAAAITANTVAGGYTVTANAPGVASEVIFNLINTPDVATRFVVTSPSSTIAGVPINYDIVAKDQFDNTATGYAGAVAFGTGDLQATLPANSTLINGAGTFNAVLRTAGTHTISATDTVTSSVTGTSGNIAVSPAAPSSIAAISGGGQRALINTAFDQPLVAQVKDAFGNNVPGVSVQFAAPATTATAGFGGSSSANVLTNAGGLATSPLPMANGENGIYSVTANVSGVAAPASYNLANGTQDPTPLQVGAVGALNRQTGFFELTVNIANTTPAPISGFRLHTDYSAYLAAHPSMRLYNATRIISPGIAYVDFPYPVALNTVTSVKLSFYTNNRQFPNPFTPSLRVETLEASDMPSTTRVGVQVDRIVLLADRSALLEFSSVAGRWYRIRYSSDMANWFICPTPIQAGNSRMQWIDSGAPFTSSHPSSAPSRFYLVEEIPAP